MAPGARSGQRSSAFTGAGSPCPGPDGPASPYNAAVVINERLERLRRICLALPEATERVSHGEPSWFVRDRKMFVTFADNHHNDGRRAFWCAAAPETRHLLLEIDPPRFFVPPYVGTRGWLGMRIDLDDVDWEQVAELVTEAYRLVAPKRLLALLDGRR
jgi:hypothetical protein